MPDSFPGNLLDPYLTPHQLAVELGVSERTLHRWHAMRVGPPRSLIGRKTYYNRSSVAAWLDRQERAPEAEMRPPSRRGA